MKYVFGRKIYVDGTEYFLEIRINEAGTRQTYILKKDDKELERRTIQSWDVFNIELWVSQIHKAEEKTKSTLGWILDDWSGQIDSSEFMQ